MTAYLSAMKHFTVGTRAEALDEFKIWTPCVVTEEHANSVKVSFVGWGSQWDRVVSEKEIRTVSLQTRKRSLKNTSYKIPQITKIVAEDELWVGEKIVSILEVDPINDRLLVRMNDSENVWLPIEEFSTNGPSEGLRPRKKKTDATKQTVMDAEQTNTVDTVANLDSDTEFDFSVFVREDGFVLKVGSVCFVDSFSCPVLLSRIFKCNEKVFISVIRCQCDGTKVVSLISDFVLTVECSFLVRICPSSEYIVSCISQQLANVIFRCQSRICKCQERNFGNVSYQRELRRHALGAKLRQAVSSGISLNATRPAQPVSLGVFEPFHDMKMFGLSEGNNFKVSFTIFEGFKLLDKLCGKSWDVKPLRFDVSDCHFKFVRSASVYLDKKNLSLKFSFSFSEAPFCLNVDYRAKCCNFLSNNQ